MEPLTLMINVEERETQIIVIGQDLKRWDKLENLPAKKLLALLSVMVFYGEEIEKILGPKMEIEEIIRGIDGK